MSTLLKVPDKGDPSDILQLFPKYNLQLLCCRYWRLSKWEFRELSFPYWRIYYNSKRGAFLNYKGTKHELLPSKIYIIAPNTSYSTHLFQNKIPNDGYAFEGERIGQNNSTTIYSPIQTTNHLFIHFNIGMPYDNISPGIFTFDLNEHLQKNIQIIIDHLNVNSSHFSFYSFLAIQALISELLTNIEESNWDLLAKDYRVLDVLSYIESNLAQDLSNVKLAGICHMATNAFARIFTDEVGISPQRFVQKKRIDTACVLLHHTDNSIEEVAGNTGFANRYHFTRIFTKTTGLSPAKYRKEFRMK